jgi:GrpB-like predicted nucleotidyltransferase (UPF0157 family)
MPDVYEQSFLHGLTSNGYILSENWQSKVKILNLIALLDCIVRSKPQKQPYKIKDIKDLISNILYESGIFLVSKQINIESYNPNWPVQFTKVAENIKLALNDNLLGIHHVGSTSVPNLAAKPKIDIIGVVRELKFNHYDLLKLGYKYRVSDNIPFRQSFIYRTSELNINLHIFEGNDPEIDLNLLFRDHLRMNSSDREDYQRLKLQLIQNENAHNTQGDMYTGYTLGKNSFIQTILKKTDFKDLRLVISTHYLEWKKVREFRNKYFFAPLKILDPYIWTFDHKAHKHFLLYKGVDIIGYLHLQLWPDKRAAIRMIVIDAIERKKSYGTNLIKLVEKWLKFQKYTSVHVESTPEAVVFYEKVNYSSMPFNDPDQYESSPNDVEMGKIL